ncbi:MAG TPA: YtxH domain-containing protein [Chitinophagaceae bacterium]|jgi:gas vesicle protein|nr:YtxH domain-containing protein [Chitinophagaceae bacterium]
MKRTTKLVTVASLLSGVLAGILLAPAKGKKSRQTLARMLHQRCAHDDEKDELRAAKKQLEQHRTTVDQQLHTIDRRLAALENNA